VKPSPVSVRYQTKRLVLLQNSVLNQRSQKGRAIENPQLNALKALMLSAVFSKSVLKSIFSKWPKRHAKMGILS